MSLLCRTYTIVRPSGEICGSDATANPNKSEPVNRRDGPLAGTAKHVGALVMGVDLLAVDATCCRLMKLPPERVPILALGAHKRLGRLKESEIPQLGESIESMATEFEMAPHVDQCLLPAEEADKVKA